MEAPPLATSDAQDWAERFNRSLQQQRDRIREFLAAQQERLARVEAELAGQVHRIGDELTQNRDETQQATDQIQQRGEQLAHEREEFESAKSQWEGKQAQWEQLQQQAVGQQEAVLAQIQRQQEELDDRWKELREQRPQIEEAAAQIRVDREALDAAQKELQAQREHLQTDQGGHDTAEHEELQRQLQAAQRREEELQRALDERPTVPAEGGAESGDDEYRRRYEMAMEDIKEINAEKAELELQLAAARDGAAAQTSGTGGGLDWEAEKQRILNSLESDYDADDEEQAAEKLKIEEVLQTTERTLTDKDEEIRELKHLLENQSGNLDSMAVGAAALGEMLDQDAVVIEERERLKAMQDEWQEKLRKAEVDISVERAKIARERAEIEEKLRIFEERGGSEVEGEKQSDKPVRGRWLERLGLKDSEDE
ncbi:MAG: hypothetical protein HQ567_34375 [Candidatus Nealsonbacteria bacterium]|nr:hypothetical protein [Candidatus Nealsonbacteria bacterium]